MNTTIKWFAGILLVINGIGALYGGGSLVLHPDGSGLQMPLSALQYSPFNNFLIPGLILFVANGLMSLFAAAALLFQWRGYAWYVMLQGCILLGWIVIQVLLLQGPTCCTLYLAA